MSELKIERSLGMFEKYMTLWVILCIAVGILLGKIAPDVAKYLDGFAIYVNGAPVVSILIALCLFFMMYPIIALLITLILLFSFKGDIIITQPLTIL